MFNWIQQKNEKSWTTHSLKKEKTTDQLAWPNQHGSLKFFWSHKSRLRKNDPLMLRKICQCLSQSFSKVYYIWVEGLGKAIILFSSFMYEHRMNEMWNIELPFILFNIERPIAENQKINNLMILYRCRNNYKWWYYWFVRHLPIFVFCGSLEKELKSPRVLYYKISVDRSFFSFW